MDTWDIQSSSQRPRSRCFQLCYSSKELLEYFLEVTLQSMSWLKSIKITPLTLKMPVTSSCCSDYKCIFGKIILITRLKK